MIAEERLYLAECRHTLLPIWERWTDGNQAMRRVLDDADGVEHPCCEADRLLTPLIEAARRLTKPYYHPPPTDWEDTTPAHVLAPWYAALAVAALIEHVHPDHVLWQIQRAVSTARRAEQEAG